MTSKLTREERVQALYDLKVGQVLSQADIENVKMLSRMALAAMDSESIMVTDDMVYAFHHALVPDAYVRDERGRMMLNGICEPKIGFGTGWNACRAAMLAAAQQEVKGE
ncbi:TPA: hypothetical protein ACH1HY_000527 [Klebsiella pneumoniae]|uniref:hypothetical protein n=1 Tax=Klebsiella pneumoniae TaxID=573 RepID=UPI0019C68A82|nr:hypothetical protein [Klebsiella pneumoniae]MBD7861898.1 hypothetical protein [Klebsiella pneumoniae]HBS7737779.1 hypothetical protein [Klebsiella pneumoniae]HBS7759078.1 hypothetical protein [Klebsiella pneumoniae]HBS7769693.1 hypothetical protein [Klebsiella pneumoniae]